jgi:superfamily II DNA or RNA helicase
LLPAPVFRATVDLQARRRLGLTATLVREDGRKGDVFELIGPKRFYVSWKDLERQAWIASATCAKEIDASLVTGKTPQSEREKIYNRFRRNKLHCILLSKVGNFAIDLPDADVLIQVSGMFGSRQEEAQRLGRTAHFFTLVSRDTREEAFAHHRKLFLTEQGYSYQVVIADDR